MTSTGRRSREKIRCTEGGVWVVETDLTQKERVERWIGIPGSFPSPSPSSPILTI